MCPCCNIHHVYICIYVTVQKESHHHKKYYNISCNLKAIIQVISYRGV